MEFDPLSALSPTESNLSDEDGSPRLKRARPSLTEDDVAGAMVPVDLDASEIPRKRDPKKRSRTTDALGEPDVEHPKLKKQKTHTSNKSVGTIIIPPRMPV
jgi:hypothetical protein